MNCTRFPIDQYAFYALGLAEPSEAAQVREHLDKKCLVCQDALPNVTAFCYIFGASTTPRQLSPFGRPSVELRKRILASIQTATGWRRMVPPQQWMRIAAGGIIAVGATSVGWNLGRLSSK